MDETDDGLVRRAIAAAARDAARVGGVLMQPSSDSRVVEVGGRRYVVLVNVGGILAVYRVRPDGILKGLKRWPKELEPTFSPMGAAP